MGELVGDYDYAAAMTYARERLSALGVTAESGNLANAAAVGITEFVWRNGPIEDAHAGARGRRNKLHDGVMFARNTWVYHQALEAVNSPKQYALLRFEKRILDRELVWPGTSGTLTQFGYGALGEIKKHVKKSIDYLMYLQETFSSEEFLLLAALQGFGASDHFGMPAWEPRVRAAMDRLRGQDPAFVERLRAVYKIDFSEILQRAPAIVHDDLPEVERALLNAPYELGAEALDWFAWNPVLDRDL
ncbi:MULTISPECIES: hypothetical protein [Streptomyces]|uniref:hypothetical protein n=1 Tax=Streptomyces TaxID=1883 RepID=UPI00035D4087|nr:MULTISPECIES: hypothetical protein [Streptomyces]MDX3363684.1 hypothetical protein [Streptomyces sp. ME02-6978.2a]MYR92281.1 hypothetical protein [Streptomyces sp. SID4937]MYW50361.1 hypothetical protein [Streptomyces sp. SID8376]GHF35964.1 hypothetical protein GCM10018783_00240 [Streptomyces griseosporeus]